jgi:hypothetical protein
VDIAFRVEKIESFVFVRDGSDNQVAVRWEVSYCCVVFADNLKTAIETDVLELPAFSLERKLNLGCAIIMPRF